MKINIEWLNQAEGVIELSILNNSNNPIIYHTEESSFFFNQFYLKYLVNGEEYILKATPQLIWSARFVTKKLIKSKKTFHMSIHKHYQSNIIKEKPGGEMELYFKDNLLIETDFSEFKWKSNCLTT